MREDRMYTWWRAQYMPRLRSQVTVAKRRQIPLADALLDWFDSMGTGTLGNVLLYRYGMEFITTLAEDLED